MLNGGVLNGHVLNGALEEEPGELTGEGLLISFEQEVDEPEGGLLILFEQSVGPGTAGGLLISFEQNVILETVGGGLLISFEQNVTAMAVGGGRLISFEQNVYRIPLDPIEIPSHFIRTGWDATIVLNGQIVTTCIGSTLRIERTEGGSAVASFVLVYQPGVGVQNVELLAGKPVTIDIRVAAGTFRVFTGVVDIPEIDLIEKKIRINCTDRRLELINAQLGATVSTIGYYSSIIFDKPKDVATELDQRLTTIPYAVDFDAYGNFTLTPKRAKAVADYVLPSNIVYYLEPRVSYTSRGRITNSIDVKFDYRFPRLHHTERTFEWVSPIKDNICLMLRDRYTLAQKSMISSAVYGSNWPIRGEITFTPIQPGGWYNCGGGPIAWVTTQLTGVTTQNVDSAGNPILDSSGKPTTTTRITGGTDFFPMFANGASWQGTYRWVQTVTESYILNVKAPQSIAQYGIVEAALQYSSSDTTDVPNWENYEMYDNPFAQSAATYHIDAAGGRGPVNAAIITALNIAKTTILNTHRDTRVEFNRFIWPQVDLRHTLEVNTSIVRARGKVVRIVHELNMSTTEAVTNVVIALSRSFGSQADAVFTVPTIPADTVDPGSGTIVLGNHYGEDPSQPGAEDWTGRVGNRFFSSSFRMTDYPEQFIVKTPPIPASVREDKQKSVSANFNIAIPNDLLEVIF